MTVTEKAAEGLARTFSVTVPKGDLADRLEARIAEIQPQVRLKGFRPGKVPASHIRKMFGRSMMEEIVEETMRESSEGALNERDLRAASPPEIDMLSDAEAVARGDEDLSFDVRVEVMPQIEPVDPKTLSVDRPVASVQDDDVDRSLQELADQQTVYEDKGLDAAAENGDAVFCDFLGKVNGEPFEGGAAEGAEVVIGAGRLVPGFEDQLIGVKAGEQRTVDITFPDDYPREDLQGQPAIFDVTVREVRGPKDVEVGDELAKLVGLESLGALKEAIRANLEREHSAQSRMRAKRRLLDALDLKHDFPLPQRMVEAEFDQIWRQVQADLERGDIDPADKEKPEDDLRAEYRGIAERRVRLGLVLAELGNSAGVQVSDEEFARALNAEARRHPGHEREVVEFFQRNEQARQQLKAPIFEEKVVDYILELADVTNTEVGREELFASED